MAGFDEQEYTKSFDIRIWKRLFPFLRNRKLDFAGGWTGREKGVGILPYGDGIRGEKRTEKELSFGKRIFCRRSSGMDGRASFWRLGGGRDGMYSDESV